VYVALCALCDLRFALLLKRDWTRRRADWEAIRFGQIARCAQISMTHFIRDPLDGARTNIELLRYPKHADAILEHLVRLALGRRFNPRATSVSPFAMAR
jgi:hypothetical protein